MVKFAHLLILSALIVWIVGSGCVGNDAAEVEESEINSDVAKAGEEAQDSGDLEINEAEILELEADMAELEALLENVSLEEDIVIEEL
ncbi:hypothetical protein MSMTP_0788 [Methanosarcina sp. MTP4]|uniref:hypothetical protein n=1 Tax=Methanosarcina sp. MTP4 TaxID=1434100 RepID=UPI0006156C41|nr:hypothetical protein [Methanosarcina sp. MTP4]AKB24257.1 hypothetical protein MSMTP_0788 [Methanosarcina sp. MTP4]